MGPLRNAGGAKASKLDNLFEVGRSLEYLLSCPNPNNDIKEDIEDLRQCLESTETTSKLSLSGTIVALDGFMESAKRGDVVASIVVKHYMTNAMNPQMTSWHSDLTSAN